MLIIIIIIILFNNKNKLIIITWIIIIIIKTFKFLKIIKFKTQLLIKRIINYFAKPLAKLLIIMIINLKIKKNKSLFNHLTIMQKILKKNNKLKKNHKKLKKKIKNYLQIKILLSLMKNCFLKQIY